ncbi:homoserine kinase [Halopolyspora algeriensis]|uniref:Homoserine kinase n=1 Tax=Halopolyspora algeriensis TaxID=1500506 RepID=A0A368VTF7_9ACTN|nr:homoserine kinase [Halopolyspora algeriensis]RCW45270.1 homoserine kinase [Halopolyspora algeriensis]TQM47311.1 homoserine kinase [Halopolyspora algeriensis]TQM53011.1 homoserine kinase [Halopolyspora algeriensis]
MISAKSERDVHSPASGERSAHPEPATSVRVTVPASTANLGSGFDTLGMALSLYDTVEVEVVEGRPGTARVQVRGQGTGAVPADENHLVVRMLQRVLAGLGATAPALRVRCHNTIPHSRGLGSSAAAIVAGITAGYTLAGRTVASPECAADVLQMAASCEGHGDNAAASLYGGLVIAWSEGDSFRATRLEPHADLRPVALVPAAESATHTTRGLLPQNVPHADAAFAASRAALAVHALTGDPDLLVDATGDRLHQDYREPAWPETIALVRCLRAAGVAAAVSGAGPTVLAFPPGGELPAGVDTAGFDVLRLPVDRAGVRVDHLS